MKGVIATMTRDKQAPSPRIAKRAATTTAIDPATTLDALAALYARVADLLLERIYEQPHNLRHARSLGQHLDWVAARAQMIDSFRQAGDCAMTYICASADSYARLVPLVELASKQLAEHRRLPVALFLLERIDEELRLV
jgi:hypothetical protein